MRFHLEASFRLSADASLAKDEVAQFFSGAGSIMQKGAPEGQGARIVQWKLEGNKIDLTIESDRYVRAHDAILRLRKPLAELLGKKYRIGVRGLEVSAVAAAGLALNVYVARLLARDAHNLNTRAALVHVMGDLLGSVAALVSGLVIATTGWTTIDPLATLVICLLLVASSVKLLREAGLKTVADALAIRSRILQAFESAEVETDPERRREWPSISAKR